MTATLERPPVRAGSSGTRSGAVLAAASAASIVANYVFLLAAGLPLIFGLMNILNLAHGAFFTLGAYSGLLASAATGS